MATRVSAQNWDRTGVNANRKDLQQRNQPGAETARSIEVTNAGGNIVREEDIQPVAPVAPVAPAVADVVADSIDVTPSMGRVDNEGEDEEFEPWPPKTTMADMDGGITALGKRGEGTSNYFGEQEHGYLKETRKQLNAMFGSLLARYENSHGSTSLTFHSGSGTMPGRAGERAAFIDRQNAGRFTAQDAQMFHAITQALGIEHQMTGVLNQMGIRTQRQKDKLLRFAQASNDLAARHDDWKYDLAEREEEYARYGGEKNYNEAMKLNAFYRANKENWGDILTKVSGDTVSDLDWDKMSRSEKQDIVRQVYGSVTKFGPNDVAEKVTQTITRNPEYSDPNTTETTLTGKIVGFEGRPSGTVDWNDTRKAGQVWRDNRDRSNRWVGPVNPEESRKPRVATGRYKGMSYEQSWEGA